MRWSRALLAACLALPLLVIFALGFGQDPHAVPSPLVGRPAPSFALVDAEGHQHSLADLKGKPIVLNFWATWCYPCQAEHDLLQQAARAYAKDVQFFGIVYQDDVERVTDYLEKHPSAYPHLIDPGSSVAIDFGISGVPESFILDRDHRVVHKEAGVLRPDRLEALLTQVTKT